LSKKYSICNIDLDFEIEFCSHRENSSSGGEIKGACAVNETDGYSLLVIGKKVLRRFFSSPAVILLQRLMWVQMALVLLCYLTL
jgi:hypothetical protein